MALQKTFLSILFFAALCTSQAQQRILSEQSHISVITYGPWQGELWSAFGHSAFRVYDPWLGIDEAYNYGVFDFDQPNFYINFALGRPYYKLGVYDYPSFTNLYIYDNRFVHEQVLDLTPEEKQKVHDYLLWNSLPENRFYQYDYFYDNCATKIRDVIIAALGDAVQFDGSYVELKYSIRNITDEYLQHQPWGDLGIDICLGLPMDKVIDPYDYMFIPNYIESGFDHAYLTRGVEKVPLVKEKIIIYESRDEELVPGLPHPIYVFSAWAFLILIISIYDFRRRKLNLRLDAVFFGILGVTGLLLFLLWVATNHTAAAKNFNLLWALPTHAVIAFALFRKSDWIKTYFLLTASIGLATLITWGILPQQLNYSLIPLVVSIIIRAAVQYWIRTTSPGGSI